MNTMNRQVFNAALVAVSLMNPAFLLSKPVVLGAVAVGAFVTPNAFADNQGAGDKGSKGESGDKGDKGGDKGDKGSDGREPAGEGAKGGDGNPKGGGSGK